MKFLLASLILVIGIMSIAAETVYSYSLGLPVIKTEGDYSIVKLSDSQSYGTQGQPDLPWFGSKILLPVGEESYDIQIKLSNPQAYSLSKPISPLQQQFPFTQENLPPMVGPDLSIYDSNTSFPIVAHNGVNTQFLAGNPINFSAVCPFSYNPVTGTLIYFSNVTVAISTHSTQRAVNAAMLIKDDAFTSQRLLRSVDNADQVVRNETRTTGYEYLIIYDTAKQAQWIPFMNIYTARGLNVLMKPIQEIYAESTGNDNQEKIRNYIINFYATNSLHHVLLAGDTDVIPHRGFYVNMGEGSYVDADIPADMYYSCLDGTWNSDNDTYWGEIYETDLAPELSIGRFCYNSDSEITNFINKTNMYLNNPVVSEVTSGLFVGEWLWDGPTWGGDYMDEMIGGSEAHGYTTVGMPTSWDISTLYDRTYGYADAWTGSQLRPLLSEGPTFVNHLGHSNTTYCMRMSSNQVTAASITNNGVNHNFSLQFTQGCYAGAFDNRDTEVGVYTSDCIAEKFTSIATSAVAMVAHSRYGWGMQGSTDGASQYIHRQYMDAIFGEEIHELGYTLTDSKIDNIPYIQNAPVMYWVTYETNVLGDPGLMIWSDAPQQVQAQLPSYWTVGLNNYQIQTNAPLANLRLKDGATILFEANADASGMINVNLLNPLTPGNFDLYIIAPDFLAFHTAISVQASDMPYIVATHVAYQDQDNLLHTGEVVNIDVTIKNVGLIDQTSQGMISLISNSPNVLILNSSYSFNPLAAADSITIAGHFSFRIQGNFADQSIAMINFQTQFDTYTANTPFAMTLNAPELSISGYQFLNGNNLIMPGDSPSLNLLVTNTGSGNAYNPILILFSDNTDVTLSAFEVQLTPIGHGTLESYESIFDVQVSENAPVGTSISIGYMLGAENGNTLEGNFVMYVGVQNYSFEDDVSDWVSSAPNAEFVNQWHQSNNRNFTDNGSYSMKFGGNGASDYTNSAYGALVSPEMALGLNSQLIFHYWMDAETHSTPGFAWDGGLVEISINNGAWTQISPVEGYPYRIYSNPDSPFAANTSVYSGSYDWTETTFDLSSYTGLAKFRFLFGSDGNVTGEGWYIDDLHVVSENVANDDNIVETVSFDLYENYPNPFNPSTTIKFDLAASSNVKLDIFNIKGQIVKSLVKSELPKGAHSIVWNGLDDANRPVSSGIYLYRLSNGAKELTRKMMLMK